MKKLISLLIVFVMMAGCFGVLPAFADVKGSGTEEDPFIITDGEQFDAIRDNPSAVYLIANDIELPAYYEPFEFSGKIIGADSYNLTSITSYVNMPSSNRDNPGGGLFTKLTGGVEIKNIRLKGTIVGGSNFGGFAGTVAGAKAGATITNCINEAEIKGINYIGGIIGDSADGNIAVTNVTNAGKVSGNICVGGIAGSFSNITFARNIGEVTANTYASGIVGIVYRGVANCYNSGTVTANAFAGGILATPSGSGRTIDSCFNSGVVRGNSAGADNNAGGIVGGVMNKNGGVIITNCHNSGEVYTGSGIYNPIHPTTDAVAPDLIKAVDCYYISEGLEDDGKEGTTAEENDKGKAGKFIADLIEKIDILTRYNNPDMKKEIIEKLGSSLTLFIGSPSAYLKKGSSFKSLRIDKDNISVVPVIQDGRTLVPARFISESLGAKVNWDDATKTVSIDYNGTNIKLVINSDKMLINGAEKIIDVPAQILNSRTLVPLRAITEALSKNVFWDERGLIVIKDSNATPKKAVVNEVVSIWLATNFDEFCAKVNNAKPGDDIVLANGVYDSINGHINVKGTKENPIIVRAQTPGEVIFTKDVGITISGQYIIFKDFRIEEVRKDTNVITLSKASDCEITECYFYDVFGEKSTFVLCIQATNVSQRNRIHHNVFERTGGGLGINVGYNENSQNFDNKADHNYYKDVPWTNDLFPGQLNGFEQAGAGGSKTHDAQTPRYIIEDNLFENIDGDRSEVICLKSSENVLRYNTFLNCTLSGPDFRNGGDSTFEGNFAINSRIGMRSYGKGQTFRNNYFYNCQRSLELTTTQEGNILEEGSQYRQTRDGLIEGNIFVYPSIVGVRFGSGFNPLTSYIDVPQSMTVKDNLFFVDRSPAFEHSNSTYDNFSNNKVVISGVGTMGTTAKGFEEADMNLVFDGEIYVPEGMKIDKRGLKSYKEVGPTNRYWEKLLKNPPDDIKESVKEPSSEQPKAYTPSKTEIYLIPGESYDIRHLTGKSTYENYEYNVLSDKVKYKISDETIAKLEGNNIKALSEGTTNIKATYKNIEANIKLKVVKPSVKEGSGVLYENKFDSKESIKNTSNPAGYWKVENGKLTNDGITTVAARRIIDNSAYLKGDYSITCDLTVKAIFDTDKSNFDGGIIVGYKDKIQPEYISVTFGTQKGNSLNGITSYNTGTSNVIGIVEPRMKKDETHKVNVTKIKDKLLASVDGVLVGVADVPEDLEGRFGFVASKIAEFDNVVIESVNPFEAPSVKDIGINVKRTDVEEVVLNYDKVNADVIYRLYINDVWVYDSFDPTYTDPRIRLGKTYKYEVRAFDKNGSLVAKGKTEYKLPDEIGPEFFQITNILVRSGVDGAFNENMYIARNKGLSGIQRIYCDRVYTFGEIPKEFENQPYIMTRAEDMYCPAMQSAKTEDFIKFDINKSATVYLLVMMNGVKTEPEWLALNGWEISTENPAPSTSFDRVYKKHYDVTDGKATVVIGGRDSKLPMHYSIILKLD